MAREFDLVIGADGLHSNVRRIVFGEETRFFAIWVCICVYSVPNYLKLDRMEIQFSELRRIAAIWSSRGDANAKACFGFAASSLRIDLQSRAQQLQALRTVYEGIGWEVPRLLEMMPTASDWYFDTAAQRWNSISACVGKDGKQSTITLGTIERLAGSTTAENLGVNLQESKQIVSRLQDTVVKQQLEEHCEQRRECLTCGRLRPVKDYRYRRLDTVLGTVRLRVPRYRIVSATAAHRFGTRFRKSSRVE